MMRHLRRIAIAFAGGTVLAVGVVMVVLPGPAVVVIPAGLGILATEFRWARRVLHWGRRAAGRGLMLVKGRGRAARTAGPAADVERLAS